MGDDVNEFRYDAGIAGLGCSLSSVAGGIGLNVYGYNDKLDVLLAKVVHVMRHLVVKKARFDVFKEALVTQVKDWKFNDPVQHALYYSTQVLITGQWTNEEVEQALEGLFLTIRAD